MESFLLHQLFAQIEHDLELLFDHLVKNYKYWIPLSGDQNMKRLSNAIYHYYNGHSRNQIADELITVVHLGLQQAFESVLRLGFHHENMGPWNKFVSWNERNVKASDARTDTCNFRIYMNVKYNSFSALSIRLVQMYKKISKGAKKKENFMFKLPKPEHAYEIVRGRIDPLVVYFDPSDAKFCARVLWHVKNDRTFKRVWFNEHVPLFTHKIAKGRSTAFDVKNENKYRTISNRWSGQDQYISYGGYMATLIADGIQRSADGPVKASKFPFYMRDLSEEQLRIIRKRVFFLVEKNLKEDLHVF